jgi:hypothetical protein
MATYLSLSLCHLVALFITIVNYSHVKLTRTLRADSNIPCRSPAATLSRPCHDLATILPLPCHSPTMPNADSRPHSVSGWPILIHAYHAVPLPRTCRGLERSLSEQHIRDMAGERHGMCESNTAILCKSNWKETI